MLIEKCHKDQNNNKIINMKMKLSNSPDFPTPRSPKSTMLYSGEAFPPARRPLITMSEKYSSLRMKKFYASVSFWWDQAASSYIIKNDKIRRTIYFNTWAKHCWMPWAQMSESLLAHYGQWVVGICKRMIELHCCKNNVRFSL